jgi:hypothetical protein
MIDIVLPDRKFAFGTKVFLIVTASILLVFVSLASLVGWFLSRGPERSQSFVSAVNAEQLAEDFVSVHQGREGAYFRVNSSESQYYPGRSMRSGHEYNLSVSHPKSSFNLVWGEDLGRGLVGVIQPCSHQCAFFRVEGDAPPLSIVNTWLDDMQALLCESGRRRIWFGKCGDGRRFHSLMLSQMNSHYLVVFRQ